MYTIWRKPSRFSFPLAPRWAPYATGILTIALSSMAGAQGQTGPVKVSPDVITVDQAKHTANVTFTNTTGDTTTVDLTLKASTPGAADAEKLDSLAKFWSLSSWITNMPAKLTLAPHETRAVALNLTVPTTLDAGEYSTYLVVHPSGAGGAQHVAAGGGGGGGITMSIPGGQIFANSVVVGGDNAASGTEVGSAEPFSATKIVYQAKKK